MASTKSFTSKKPPIDFDVDGEEFTAYSVLPATTFGKFAEKVTLLQRASKDYSGPDKEKLSLDETITTILDAVELGLTADSAARVAARIVDPENPIDLETLSEVLLWLLEQYGIAEKSDSRPTPPTSDSPTGSEPTGDGSAES